MISPASAIRIRAGFAVGEVYSGPIPTFVDVSMCYLSQLGSNRPAWRF
jgi:hypothetical protein